jgi:hypothetical protein
MCAVRDDNPTCARDQYTNGNHPPFHAGCIFVRHFDAMKLVTFTLTSRIFLAIAATALLVVAVMAMMVALSMRDGFSRYLLQGEINRFC